MVEFALTQTDTEIGHSEILLEEVQKTSVLVVHNDEVNTFDYIIDALTEICKMTTEQAEQCTLIIHFKGKYGVKEGSSDELTPFKDAFIERGIGATIE